MDKVQWKAPLVSQRERPPLWLLLDNRYARATPLGIYEHEHVARAAKAKFIASHRGSASERNIQLYPMQPILGE
jgi:hypothetical protein